MSITTLQDWYLVEAKAAAHEKDLAHVETPKAPTPTPEQQLAWATVRCAELQAKIHRMQGKASEALMWLTCGDRHRTQQAINQVILDL